MFYFQAIYYKGAKCVSTKSWDVEIAIQSRYTKTFFFERGIFSTGSMGALAPAILKNRLVAPPIFGHLSTVEKNCGC